MRQRRWQELIKDYDHEIRYHPGKANLVADALSRKKFTDNVKFMRIEIVSDLIDLLKIAQLEALKDEHLKSEILVKRIVDLIDDSRGLKTLKLQENLGTRVNLSTTYHPQTDGQSECTIQTLEDTLRACVLEYGGSWDSHLPLIEFAYNNSYHSSIGMPPYEMLYGRRCRMPTCWLESREKQFVGPEIVQLTAEKVAIAREKLKAARDRQNMYADPRRRPVIFTVGEQILPLQDLKVDMNKKLVEEPVRIVDKKITKLQHKQIPMDASVRLRGVSGTFWVHPCSCRVHPYGCRCNRAVADAPVRLQCRRFLENLFWP
ncbi:uncharacterized protein [Rutidosis leptorrhynchoides]|uniref:uncharacterized protein n=1 Tax=Rutidosis leptorrhynchoides TaxID=125765 RepID=UPI003A99D7A9